MNTQDATTVVVATGGVGNYFYGWYGLLPDQNLQVIVLELSALWLLIQIGSKIYGWVKGKNV